MACSRVFFLAMLNRGANGEGEGGENRVGTLAIGRVGKRGEREREREREGGRRSMLEF